VTKTKHRLAGLVLVALVACSPAPVPSSTALPTGAASASAPLLSPPASAAGALGLCAASDLGLTATRQGESGSVNIEIDFTNTSQTACVLPALPIAIALLGSNGIPLEVATIPPPTMPPSAAIVRPGVGPDSALIAYWSSWCLPAPGPLTVVVTLTVSESVRVPLPGSLLPRCDTPGRQSFIQIDSIVALQG
jgi:hypothetical protein